MTKEYLTYHKMSRSDVGNASLDHHSDNVVPEGGKQLPHERVESVQPAALTLLEVPRSAAENTPPNLHDDSAPFEELEQLRGDCAAELVPPTFSVPQESGHPHRGEYRCPLCASPTAGSKKGKRWFAHAAGIIDHA